MTDVKNTTQKTLSQLMFWLYIVIAAGLYFLALWLPFGHFSPAGKHAFAVFCVATFLWITNIFPIAITGIVVLFLLPITGAISSTDVYSYFGNSAIFFVLGAFILASPVMRSGLSRRIAIKIMIRFGKGPKRLLFSIFCLSALLAFIISEHAVAAMMLPIVLEILKYIKSQKGSHFGFATVMAMAWGAMIGGTATLLGGARAPLTLGILSDTYGQNPILSHYSYISFLDWTIWVIPIVIATLCFAFLSVYLIVRKSKVDISEARLKLIEQNKQIGRITRREVYTLLVLIATVSMWVFYGTNWGLDWIALMGVILAFCFKITRWEEVEKDVHWGIFIMYGSAIALSVSLKNTGAAQQMVEFIIQYGRFSPLMIMIMLMILAFILTEIMSNAAAVAVLLPVGLALAPQFGIDPRAIAIVIATCAGLTFMLPVSTPAMALALNSKYVNQRRVLLWGLWLKSVSFIVVLVTILLYWPLIGLSFTLN
ncbi:MAG: SLC13 family permease [Francisellaceae bacterium]